MTIVTDTLNEDQCTFFIICRLFVPKMRHVPANVCRENKNTHFVFSDVSRKIMPFMR